MEGDGDPVIVPRHVKAFGVVLLVALLLGAVLMLPVALHDVAVIREYWGW